MWTFVFENVRANEAMMLKPGCMARLSTHEWP